MDEELVIKIACKARDYTNEIPAACAEARIWNNVFNHKFAELIVQECILTIQGGITRDGCDTEKYLRSMQHIKDIKKRFGVKE